MKGHEWSTEQVKSAKKPNYSKLYVVTPALMDLEKKFLKWGAGRVIGLKF